MTMATPLPRVRIVATGGTIAEIWPHRVDYVLHSEVKELLTIEKSLARIPEVKQIAEVQGEDFLSVGSAAIGPEEWLRLAQRINQIFQEDPAIAGVVVTHGTATLEETAYFLHLTIKTQRPVVLTGSMRPPSAMSSDADVNLLDAIRVASCADAVGKGVLTVLNNQIQSAREVSKANTLRAEAFRPSDLGFLGYADSDGQVVFYRTLTRKHTTSTPFDVSRLETLPRVDVVHAYGGADGLLVDAVRQHESDGLILVGFGGGTYPPDFELAGARAVRDGIPVVLASRVTSGRVVMTPLKEEHGFIVCDNLHPQQARTLLMLGLTVTRDRKRIQQMFLDF